MTSAPAAVRAAHARERAAWGLGAGLAAGAILIGLLAGALVVSGRGPVVFGLGAIALVVVLWKAPQYSPVVLLAAALTIEQFPLGIQPGEIANTGVAPSDITDRIPLFHGLAQNLHVSLADLLVLTLLAIWLLKSGTSNPVPRSPTTFALAALLFAVLIGLVVGQAHHGSLRTSLTEIRPYAYLAVGYLIASVYVTSRSVIRAAFWAFVLGSGLKAFQAIHSFLKVRHESPRPDFVVGHEEALFFALFILLTLALWVFDVRGPLRKTATALAPVVLLADLVNSRRTAWLILAGALLIFALITMVAVPARRRLMSRILIVVAVISAVYFPAYWNHTGALAGPARALHSAIAPNPRDESSDQYRVQEDANLKGNIRQGGVIGKGFGVPIDYTFVKLADIRSIDPLIDYIPHNGVFYILMRMGVLGGIAFWSLLGVGIIGACRLVRSRDREVAVLGVLVACGLFGYALEGYNDQGFFMYRVAFVIGSLLGLAEGARRLNERRTRAALAVPAPVAAPTPALAPPAPSPRRRKPAVPSVGRNFTALAAGQLVTWTMTLLWTIVVPNALGPSGLGLLFTALAVTGVFSILLGLGTRNYLVREIVVDRTRAPSLVGTGIVLRLLLAPVFALAIVVYAQFANYGHEGTLVLYLVTVSAILILLAEPMLAGFQALEQMKYLAYSDVINKSAQGLIGIALVFLGFRAVGLAASMAVIAAVVFVLDAIWLRRFFPLDLRATASRIIGMLRESVAYWAFGLFFMIYLWIDSMLLSLLTRSEVVGWYAVPMRLFQTLMFFPVLLSTAWLPRLVSAYEESPQRLRKEARAPLELALLLSAPICAGTAILAGPVIHLLYKPSYDSSIPVLIILGLCLPPMYLNIMLNQVLVAAKRQVLWTWVMAGATIVNPLLNFALIPLTEHRYGNGAIGAALSLLVTEAIIVIAGFVLVGRDVLDRFIVRRGVAVAAAAVAMWGAAYLARPFGPVVAIAVGTLTFAAVARVTGAVTAEEIELVRSAIRNRRRRD
jgi:O-antigen/teichoic acid export membrane protein